MTTVQALELLVRYGDALEETFPKPVNDRPLIAAVQDVPNMFELDDESAIELSQLEQTDDPSRSSRMYIALVAAAVLLIAIIGVRVVTGESEVRTADIPDGTANLVFPGETVLQTDPLIVSVPAPPEPGFDTSGLGERIVYEPVIDFDPTEVELLSERMVELASLPGFGDAELRKLSLLGMTNSGLIAVGVIEFTAVHDVAGYPSGSRLRTRLVADGDGVSGGSIDPADNSVDSFRQPATYEEIRDQNESGISGMSLSASNPGTAPAKSTMEIEVTLDVAVLQLTIAGESVWTVPIEGIALLPTELNNDTPFEIVTFDSVGNEITRRTTTPDNG